MVLTLMLPLRAIYKLEDLITQYHIDCMCKITLATGTMVGYAYAMEFFIAWYGANPYEGFTFINRAFGPYAWAYWIMITCNVITPQFFWFKARAPEHDAGLGALALRQRGHVVRAVRHHLHLAGPRLPALELGLLSPTVVEIFTFFGTFGVFSVAVPALHPLPAHDADGRDQGRHAAGRRPRRHRPPLTRTDHGRRNLTA